MLWQPGSAESNDNTKVNSAHVAETVCALKELSVYNSVSLVCTPGHCGILGNKTARQASATKYTGLEPALSIMPPTVKYIMNYNTGHAKKVAAMVWSHKIPPGQTASETRKS